MANETWCAPTPVEWVAGLMKPEVGGLHCQFKVIKGHHSHKLNERSCIVHCTTLTTQWFTASLPFHNHSILRGVAPLAASTKGDLTQKLPYYGYRYNFRGSIANWMRIDVALLLSKASPTHVSTSFSAMGGCNTHGECVQTLPCLQCHTIKSQYIILFQRLPSLPCPSCDITTADITSAAHRQHKKCWSANIAIL